MRGRTVIGVAIVGVFFAAGAAAKEWTGKVPAPAERGRELYERHCQACHGPKAAGDGPAAASLVAKVPDLSQGFGARSQDQLVPIVLRGKGAMPGFDVAFRDLKPLDGSVQVYARNVLDHMAGLGRGDDVKPAVEAPAREAEGEEAGGGDAP
jgi:mono/diheme cytochrome c family protein